MSYSNNEQFTSPVTKYLKWKGSVGQFFYYDKEQSIEVAVDLPFHFLVLDELSQIIGFEPSKELPIYSNEVKFIGSEHLNVRVGKSTVQHGLYKDIKGHLPAGSKFAKCVYVLNLEKDEIWKMTLAGSSIGPWIELGLQGQKLVIKVDRNPDQKKKGTTLYYEPSFVKVKKPNEESDLKAYEADKLLQEFFKAKKGAIREEETSESNNDTDNFVESKTSYNQAEMMQEDDDLPF